ncbi:MAG: hypothetical protein HDS75_04575 [Bacteroidales bacterium]|nr:hypothetical protein [Bacteroidales bacterium]
MNKAKTITLTIDEFTQIIEISDMAIREAVLTAVRSALEDPDSISPDDYADSHPLISTLINKIKSRAESARMRAEKRKANRALPKPVSKASTPGSADMMIDMPLNDSTVRRLLWVKQNYAVAIDNIMRILAAQSGNTLGRELSTCFSEIAEAVKAYLRPLIDAASGYFRTPRHLRPHTVRVPIPARL